jgi:predicted RNA-binding Zn-ribbon protein involved in translation (DUF1610 family)
MSDTAQKKPGPGAGSRAAAGAGAASGDPLAPAVPVVMIKCPKCGGNARDIARFCPRCHATLRYQCPACAHEQRHGGTCDACQIDFVKYVTAVVTQKQAEADVIHDRIERRSGLVKNLLLVPITGGFTLLRYLFVSRDRK